MRLMAERKGQVYVYERTIVVQLPASKKLEHTLPAD